MSRLAFLNARSWLDDEDGIHIWTEHDCVNGRVATMLPWPTWRIRDGEAWPSFSCGACDAHYFMTIGPTPVSSPVTDRRPE